MSSTTEGAGSMNTDRDHYVPVWLLNRGIQVPLWVKAEAARRKSREEQGR